MKHWAHVNKEQNRSKLNLVNQTFYGLDKRDNNQKLNKTSVYDHDQGIYHFYVKTGVENIFASVHLSSLTSTWFCLFISHVNVISRKYHKNYYYTFGFLIHT